MLYVFVSAALAAAPSPGQAQALTGKWTLAEPRAAVQARVDAAIDALIGPYNLLVRSVARPRLEVAAVFCDAYRSELTAVGFTIGCDARGEATAVFDGPPTPGVAADGRGYQLSGRFEREAVVLDFRGEEGWQRVRYSSGTDATLLVEKTVHSERLGGDVAWKAMYLRLVE